jgi:UDP-2,4-diacetamido-2,4,6-trideoxy-beta-L-altropyranose hydrolase
MTASPSDDMQVVFRADASVRLGTGHVRRCLELASRLAARGASVMFVCAGGVGDMIDEVSARGMRASRLRAAGEAGPAAWEPDAGQTAAAIAAAGLRPHWLVVDHYGLDRRWERALRAHARRIMAIDDLADRAHDCEMLLDQNLTNPRHARYRQLLPAGATQLLGCRYALLGAEFARVRAAALARRRGQLERVLISMGGTDPSNDTARALDGLQRSRCAGIAVDVVIGAANPHRAALEARCSRVPGCTLHVQTARMADLMTQADLAISGGGSTTWERCALGLPAIAVSQSQDQVAIARAMAEAGGQMLLGPSADVRAADYAGALDGMTAAALRDMSAAAAGLCDGEGAERVATQLTDWRDG